MKYDFSRRAPRKNMGASKWDLMMTLNPEVSDDVVPLSVADMEFITAPEIREGLKKYIDEQILGYNGMWDGYLEALSNWTSQWHNWSIKPEWIVNTPGVVSAIYAAIETYTTKIRELSYYHLSIILLKPQLKIQEKRSKSSLHEKEGYYTIDFDALEETLSDPQNRLLIFCNPHNPVGRVWKKEELAKVFELCKKHDVILVSDEIWWDLILPGYTHVSMGEYTREEDNVIICTAASKTFNLAGLATSNIIIPNKGLREEFSAYLEKTHSGGVGILGLVGTQVGYDEGRPWLEELLQVLDENRRYMEEFFSENFPEVVYSPMEGTYLFWVNLNSLGLSPQELEEFMIHKAQLFLDEGYIFGEEGKGWERFNIACPKEVLIEATEALKKSLSD